MNDQLLGALWLGVALIAPVTVEHPRTPLRTLRPVSLEAVSANLNPSPEPNSLGQIKSDYLREHTSPSTNLPGDVELPLPRNSAARDTKGKSEVSHVVFLRGKGIRKSPLNVAVSPELMREVHNEAERLELILVGQIHSHSGLCGVDMSPSDHAYGVSVPYFLSVICPDFAQNPETTLVDCGVHVCLPDHGYVRLLPNQLERKVVLLPSQVAGTSVIGEKL